MDSDPNSLRLDDGKYTKTAFRTWPTHQNQAIGPLRWKTDSTAAQFQYDCHGFEANLENVGQKMTVRKGDTMRFRFSAAFSFSLLLFSLPAAYADEISEGRDFFIKRCLGCHAFACSKEGPRLGGLFGRKVATVEDYKFYSQGLKNSDIVWTRTTLDNFFENPGKLFPESTMATNGLIEDAVQRQKLIAFLETEDPTVNLCPQE